MRAYGVLYRWFTDVSGLGLPEQARRLMQPEPPKKEEDLAESIDGWLDKLRRQEAHGDAYKLAAVFKLDALRTLTAGKAREYFDLWEDDRDNVDAAKSFMELLNKLKDFARRRKLDTVAQKNIQQGGDPMDVGAVTGWGVPGVYDDDHDGVCAVGVKGEGKSKGKGKEECYNCGSSGHFARE